MDTEHKAGERVVIMAGVMRGEHGTIRTTSGDTLGVELDGDARVLWYRAEDIERVPTRWLRVCAGCMGLEPPDGSDPREGDPTKHCNPDYCDLARWQEKTGGAQQMSEPERDLAAELDALVAEQAEFAMAALPAMQEFRVIVDQHRIEIAMLRAEVASLRMHTPVGIVN